MGFVAVGGWCGLVAGRMFWRSDLWRVVARVVSFSISKGVMASPMEQCMYIASFGLVTGASLRIGSLPFNDFGGGGRGGRGGFVRLCLSNIESG